MFSQCELDQSDVNILGRAASAARRNETDLTEKQITFGSVQFIEEIEFDRLLGDALGQISYLNCTFRFQTTFSGLGKDDKRRLYFDHCTFLHRAVFSALGLLDSVIEDSTFGTAVQFRDTAFDETELRSCTFLSWVNFDKCKIGRDFKISGTTRVNEQLSISNTTIGDEAWMGIVECQSVLISDCKVGRGFRVSDLVTNDGPIHLLRTEIGDDATLDQVRSSSFIAIVGCSLGRRTTLELASSESFHFYDSTFGDLSNLSLVSPEVSLERCNFPGGGTLRFSSPNLSLQTVRSSESITVSSLRELPERLQDVQFWTNQALLTGLKDVDLARFTLLDIDLTQCVFEQTSNLDKIRIQQGSIFARRSGKGISARNVIKAEKIWRGRHEGRSRLNFPRVEPLGRSSSAREDARTIEETYRSLRKGLEDSGNQPGAADFYYGEMEMRRNGTASRWERYILHGYWLASGYGLRAWRSAALLILTLVLATVAFGTVGFREGEVQGYAVSSRSGITTLLPENFFKPKPGFVESASYTIRAATSLTRPGTPPPLTLAGEVTEFLLRILAPLFLALSLLAIRGRVKR